MLYFSVIDLIEEVKIQEIDFYLSYNRIKSKFNYYDGYRNNCSNIVKKFLSETGVDVSQLTAYADTVRTLGPIQYSIKNFHPYCIHKKCGCCLCMLSNKFWKKVKQNKCHTLILS